MLCPECGSADVVPIVYGLPAPELFESAERGGVVLGGCVVGFDGEDPTHACKACGARFNAEGRQVGSQTVIVRYLWDDYHRAGHKMAFVIELAADQVVDWTLPDRVTQSREEYVAGYLERSSVLAERFPGTVVPGHVTCIVSATGEVIEAFVDPWMPYASQWNGDSPLLRLGVLVDSVGAVADIPRPVLDGARQQGISSLGVFVAPGWAGTNLANTRYMRAAMKAWNRMKEERSRD